MKGALYGIGLGPGDPQLITLKAQVILQEANIILIPQSAKMTRSAARDIIEGLAINGRAEYRELRYRMDKKNLDEFWDEQALKVVKEIEVGKVLAYVTLGDVGVYSTFGYLQQALSKIGSYRVARIPGISSFQLAAARLGVDLALGEENLGIFPLPRNINDLDDIVATHDAVILMKIGSRLGELRDWLCKREMELTASFARRVGFDNEYVLPSLKELPIDEKGGLSVVIIRKVKEV